MESYLWVLKEDVRGKWERSEKRAELYNSSVGSGGWCCSVVPVVP